MSPDAAGEQPLRVRLLVVEDSFPVAQGLKFLLQTMGCEVVGMAGNVQTALDLVATTRFDAALLDIDLHGERVTPVAEAVLQRGLPVLFLSGYGDASMLPAHLQALPRLEKPVEANQLIAILNEALKITTLR
jgi:DNA-binding NtrC family response regulator